MDKNSLIWQPKNLYQPSYEFDVLLSRQFAVEMLQVRMTQKTQRRMNELGAELTKRFKGHEEEPYLFHQDTAFVRQINFDSGKGIWLALTGLYGKAPDLSEEEPLKYTTHNMECNSDKFGLLCLFDNWINYSQVLKELK